MRHWVPAGAQELGRDTAATWELREAGEESLTNRISLSAVFQLKPGMGGAGDFGSTDKLLIHLNGIDVMLSQSYLDIAI
jgi:hypothetical protein